MFAETRRSNEGVLRRSTDNALLAIVRAELVLDFSSLDAAKRLEETEYAMEITGSPRSPLELDSKFAASRRIAPVPLPAASGCSGIGQQTFAARQAVTPMRPNRASDRP